MATHTLRMRQAESDRAAGHMTLRRFFYENGLTLVLMGLFAFSLGGQILTGWSAYNTEQQDHAQPQIALGAYLGTGHFWEAISENWESEFLQMAAFVWLTVFFFQKGSPESKAPYEQDAQSPVTEKSPWPARRGGWVLKLYQNSLTLAFLFLFLIAFIIHGISGQHLVNEEQIEHGQATVTLLGYMSGSQFWFESFQNWQSEFLSIAAMVVFAIFLRQKGSPESKPVQAPHSENE